jgi:hypothetical protein
MDARSWSCKVSGADVDRRLAPMTAAAGHHARHLVLHDGPTRADPPPAGASSWPYLLSEGLERSI